MLLLSASARAQVVKTEPEDTQNERPKYEVPANRTKYIRISIDPTRYLYPFIDGITRGGFEITADTEVKGRYFPVFEVGHEFVSLDKPNYQLSANGVFFKAGVDNNFLKYQDKDDRDMFFLGVRVAYSAFNQDAENIILNQSGTEEVFNYPNVGFNMFWGELVVGVKTELVKNFFLGWTVRAKQKFKASDQEVSPYLVPGYGKFINDINIGANIYFSYALPIKKPSVTK